MQVVFVACCRIADDPAQTPDLVACRRRRVSVICGKGSCIHMKPPNACSRPTAACVINHHNYGAFIGEAVRGALRQTVPFDEIIVVDDGSSPEHLGRVREACAIDPRIRLVEKSNQGQLSCFNVGFERSTADILFFLDADDFWDAGYLEAALAVYTRRPDISFIMAARRLCFEDGRTEEQRFTDRDLGYSVVLCHRSLNWVGAPTSCLSVRREVLACFLPFEARQAWKTCADECLVYGTSLAGARKFALGSVHVNYRIHGANAWHGRSQDISVALLRRFEGLRLVESLRRKLAIPADLGALAPLEFRTLESTNWRDFRKYAEIIMNSGLGIQSKFGALFNLSLTHWFGRKRETRG